MSDSEAPSSRAVIVEGGVVTNVIVVALEEDGSTTFSPDGVEIVLLPADSEVTFGWTWDGTEFHPPEE